MADWEKVNFQKTSKDYKSDPVAVLARKSYVRDGVRKSTYRISFNLCATELLKSFVRYDGRILIDVVSGNAGAKVGIVKGDTFECKYRYKRSLLEISSKKLLDFLEQKFGEGARLKLQKTDNGVIALICLED